MISMTPLYVSVGGILLPFQNFGSQKLRFYTELILKNKNFRELNKSIIVTNILQMVEFDVKRSIYFYLKITEIVLFLIFFLYFPTFFFI